MHALPALLQVTPGVNKIPISLQERACKKKRAYAEKEVDEGGNSLTLLLTLVVGADVQLRPPAQTCVRSHGDFFSEAYMSEGTSFLDTTEKESLDGMNADYAAIQSLLSVCEGIIPSMRSAIIKRIESYGVHSGKYGLALGTKLVLAKLEKAASER